MLCSPVTIALLWLPLCRFLLILRGLLYSRCLASITLMLMVVTCVNLAQSKWRHKQKNARGKQVRKSVQTLSPQMSCIAPSKRIQRFLARQTAHELHSCTRQREVM